MLIAYDGGALQEAAPAGSAELTIGLLNAAVQLDPSFSVVLVTDPRLGAVKPELLDRLAVRPETVSAEVAPSAEAARRGLLTANPDIRFVVDGFGVPARVEDDRAWYEGPPPRESFVIASRSARPADVAASSDRRILGVPVIRVIIDDRENPPRVIAHDDPQLGEGFGSPEAGWRWTTGAGIVPLACFPEAANVRVEVQLYPAQHRYRIGGSFDRAFNRIEDLLTERSRRLVLSNLAADLAARGAQIYVADRFMPVAVPGLKLACWAYQLPNHPGAAAFFRAADYVFAVSEQSRQRLVEMGVAADRVITTGVGVGEHAPCGPETIAGVREKYRLAGDYILCVGTLEPRRHHHRILQAYHRFAEMTPEPPLLVIVGKPGAAYQPLLTEIEERGLRDRVHVLREVDRAELAALYSDALFVVYPSIYEGFRLPLLDALAYRKPVVTLRNSIMSEVAGDAALAIDPENIEEIADSFARLASDAQYRAEMVRCGEARRDAAHQWPEIARIVVERLQALAQQ